MHWTKELPTKSGWYWFDCNGGIDIHHQYEQIIEISVDIDGIAVIENCDHERDLRTWADDEGIEIKESWWSNEPIAKPTGGRP